jgi:2-polyprenyl-6-methoxyphenol hydroxylase-like FAD-dependent oxidoreductase
MRVLISGAGVAGPALAYFLAKAGARITLVEKAPALLPHGQNVDITGSAVAVIKKMGLLDEVKRYHTKEKGTQLIDSSGQAFAPFPVKEGSIASPTSEFEILRGDMAKVLYEASKTHPNVSYIFDTTIKQVLSNSSSSVQVELSNGVVQEFDLLVAADGQWSKVRKQCFLPESVTVVDKNMYAVYFTVPRLEEDNDWWNVYFGLQSRIITLRPDPHGTIRAMFTIMPRNETQKAAWQDASRAGRQKQEELVKSEFANAGWQAQRLLDAMTKAPDFYFQAIQQIKMDKWSSERVVCLGDTAFAPTPLTGMGTSLAILGGYMLAGELAKLKDGEHPKEALEAYEEAFRPFVEQTQEVPGIVPGVAHPDVAWKRWLLQTALSMLSKAAGTPWLVNMLGAAKSAEENDDGFKLPQYGSLDQVL